jgi:transcriptional regulator with XRE-family HTH domain
MGKLSSLSPFGLKCRELRLNADRRIIEHAEMLGITPADISDYELGRKVPSEEYVRRTAYWLRIEPHQLEALLARRDSNCGVAKFDNRERRELRDSRRIMRKAKSLSAMIVRLDDYRSGDKP